GLHCEAKSCLTLAQIGQRTFLFAEVNHHGKHAWFTIHFNQCRRAEAFPDLPRLCPEIDFSGMVTAVRLEFLDGFYWLLRVDPYSELEGGLSDHFAPPVPGVLLESLVHLDAAVVDDTGQHQGRWTLKESLGELVFGFSWRLFYGQARGNIAPEEADCQDLAIANDALGDHVEDDIDRLKLVIFGEFSLLQNFVVELRPGRGTLRANILHAHAWPHANSMGF